MNKLISKENSLVVSVFSLDNMEFEERDVEDVETSLCSLKKFYLLTLGSGKRKICKDIPTEDEINQMIRNSEDRTYVVDTYKLSKGCYEKLVVEHDEELLPILLGEQGTTYGELQDRDKQLREYYASFGYKFIDNVSTKN